MAYKHGVSVTESPTAIKPAVNTTAGLPVVYGTAPLHLASAAAEANKPVLCYTYAEAVAAFGYSDDWKKYTLCEAIYSEFSLYAVKPIVLINVLDPSVHKTSVTKADFALTSGTGSIADSVLLDTLVVQVNNAGQPLTEGTDYTAAYNDDEEVVITALEGGLLAKATTCYVKYDKLDASKVDNADIIGGISTFTGTVKGLETLNMVYPMFGIVPGIVAAPGWSDKPEIAAVMKAKAATINNLFKATVLTDIPTDEVTKYSDVNAWKNQNNYTGEDQVVCWPMAKLGNKIIHLSTHVMGVCGIVDAANDDIPYKSPSNETLQADGLCLSDGTEVIIGPEIGAYLNGQGIITGLNFNGGWKLWGNRTGCYPANTDPKDSFLCVRRMFNWHRQTFILTYWNDLDKPINKRLINLVVDSENYRLNGLVARGYLLGGKIEFRSEDNPRTDLIDGIIRFKTKLTPPVPARNIEDDMEFDTSYFDSLFN